MKYYLFCRADRNFMSLGECSGESEAKRRAVQLDAPNYYEDSVIYTEEEMRELLANIKEALQ